MAINLRGKSFLTLADFTTNEIKYLLKLAIDLKIKRNINNHSRLLDNKNVVLIFEKPSTRTRCAFEMAGLEEGANVTFLADSHLGKKESIADTAAVLGRYYDGIEFRGFKQHTVEELAIHAGIPVWNGLTDDYHPTQVLADFLTIQEHVSKPLHKVKLVYFGDANNNVTNSLRIGAEKLGLEFVVIGPPKSKDEILSLVKGADVIYTDVWASMGEEDQLAERIAMLKPYQVTMEILRATKNSDVIFMHCLPACHDTNTEFGKKVFEKFGLREMEVTDEVFQSPNSVVFDQAENRLHTIKAVMVATIG